MEKSQNFKSQSIAFKRFFLGVLRPTESHPSVKKGRMRADANRWRALPQLVSALLSRIQTGNCQSCRLFAVVFAVVDEVKSFSK